MKLLKVGLGSVGGLATLFIVADRGFDYAMRRHFKKLNNQT